MLKKATLKSSIALPKGLVKPYNSESVPENQYKSLNERAPARSHSSENFIRPFFNQEWIHFAFTSFITMLNRFGTLSHLMTCIPKGTALLFMILMWNTLFLFSTFQIKIALILAIAGDDIAFPELHFP